jgi:hypothetical protein
MKKITLTPDNPNGTIVDLTTEEITEVENNKVKDAEELQAMEAKEALKASAKAKLVAGEALTEEEANTIVL